MPTLKVDRELCNRCGDCRTICPLRLIQFVDDGWPGYIPDGALRCIVCGHCEAVCQSGALQVGSPQVDPRRYGDVSCRLEPGDLANYLRMRRSVRHFSDEAVSRETIQSILDVVRYAPSGTNSQSIHWLVIHSKAEVQRLTALVIEWMRHVQDDGSPVSRKFNFAGMIHAWDEGRDPICRNAPHLLIAHAEQRGVTERVDAHIALSYFDVAAPAYGLGTCWGGFFQFAAEMWPPLQEALHLPEGHASCYAMMFGYPTMRFWRPPKRNYLNLEWR